MYARIGTALLLLFVTAVSASAANEKKHSSSKTAQTMGSTEEQAACTPDATKFCNDKIPDTFAVLACLKTNRQHLTKACRHVLEANGQ